MKKKFLLYLVDVVDDISWFSNVEPDLHTWNKFLLVVVYNSFHTLLDSIAIILLRVFASMFNESY